MGNNTFFFQFVHSKSWNFCKKNRGKLIMYMFLLMFLIEGYRLYRYYNRLEFIRKIEYKGDIFAQYQDWSKSTGYYVNVYRRCDEKNYYVIKKMEKYILNIGIITRSRKEVIRIFLLKK